MTQSEHISLADVAERLNLSQGTIRRTIKSEYTKQLPDCFRLVPGGRICGTNYRVFRAIFERGLAGELADQPETPSERGREVLELHITGTWVVADEKNPGNSTHPNIQLVPRTA